MPRIFRWLTAFGSQHLTALERTWVGKLLDYASLFAILALIVLWSLPTLVAAFHAAFH